MKAESPFCKVVCCAVFRERLFINTVLQHPDPFLANIDKGETSQGTESPTEMKKPGHCCRSPFAQESCSPCIRLLVRKPSSSLSTEAGSKQKVFIFSSRYQLKFSSTMLNIRAKALAAPVPSIEVSSAVPKLQTKRKVIKKALEGIEFKSDNKFGALEEIWCSAHDL